MTDVKICGLSTRAAVDAAIAAGANHIGFVFFPASPRNVAPDEAAALGRNVPHGLLRVGVFVDPDDSALDAAKGACDIIQLHGDAPPERTQAVRARTGLPVWRAVGVATRGDVAAAQATARGADRLLFDAKAPKGSVLPGGNGLRFDWHLLGGVAGSWGLSGGLDAVTVGAAIRLTGAPLVDVSSGVEDAPGVKSLSEIKAFLAAVRAA